MPAVIVEVGPDVAPGSLLRELLAACSAAMRRDASCEVAREPEPEDTVAVAIVKWTDGESAARIEVGIRRKDRAAAWETRVIGFRKADARDEKWRAAGLTIATLVGERTESPPAESGSAGDAGDATAVAAADAPVPTTTATATAPTTLESPPQSDLQVVGLPPRTPNPATSFAVRSGSGAARRLAPASLTAFASVASSMPDGSRALPYSSGVRSGSADNPARRME